MRYKSLSKLATELRAQLILLLMLGAIALFRWFATQ